MSEATNTRPARAAKKLYVKTYGCQMNVYDSARMEELLAPHGYQPVAGPDNADMIILNTCHIREKAAEKVYSELGRLKALKQSRAEAGDRLIVAVAGCVAQAEGEAMLERARGVDIVVGPQAYHRLPELIARAARARDGRGVIDIDLPAEPKFDFLPASDTPSPVSAFLSVQEGCDKFCTFCVVPYTRGAEYSRSVDEIVAEAEALVARGAREITLLGQNVNAYRGRGGNGQAAGLGELIRRLAEIPLLARLRYTTSHPRDMDEGLIAAHGDVPTLMPFLHLPVQSGSDKVLMAMNRQHGAADYHRLVERLRRARPDLALSSDFIVGFPGESDADFRATLDLVEAVGFAQAFSFKYSPRPGTPAAALPQIEERVKAERLALLQERLRHHQRAFNAASRGATHPVLVERAGRQDGQLAGRTPHFQPIHFAGSPSLIGRIVEVEVTASHDNSLAGCLPTRFMHDAEEPMTECPLDQPSVSMNAEALGAEPLS